MAKINSINNLSNTTYGSLKKPELPLLSATGDLYADEHLNILQNNRVTRPELLSINDNGFSLSNDSTMGLETPSIYNPFAKNIGSSSNETYNTPIIDEDISVAQDDYFGIPNRSPYQYDINSAVHQLGTGIGNVNSGNGSVGNTFGNIVAPAVKSTAMLARGFLSGMTSANMSAQVQANELRKREDARLGIEKSLGKGGYFYGADGGTKGGLDPSDLTGEHIRSLSDESSANSIIEGGEYIMDTSGEIAAAEGDKHSDPSGGMKVNLEDGSMVLSDQKQLGNELSSKLKKELGVNVLPRDTYSSAIDKYKSKIGLKSAYENQEKLINRLKSNNNLLDSNTKEINKEFLSGKIKESEDKIKPLEEELSLLFSVLFDAQESSKSSEDAVSFANGGTFRKTDVALLAKKHGLSVNEAMGIMDKFSSKMPSFETGGKRKLVFSTDSNVDNKYLAGYEDKFGHQSTTNFGFGDIKDKKVLSERFGELARIFPGLSMGKDAVLKKAEDGVYSLSDNKQTSDLQEYVNNVYIANGKLGDSVENNDSLTDYLGKISFSGDGVRSKDNKLGNYTSTRPSLKLNAVTEEQKKALNDIGITNYVQLEGNEQAKGILGNEYNSLLDLSKDNPSLDFYLDSYAVDAPNIEPVKNVPINNTPVNNKSAEVKNDKIVINNPDPKDSSNQRSGFLTPEQWAMPPSPIDAPYLQQVGFTPIDSSRLEVPYEEIYKREVQALMSMDGVPDSQKQGLAANISAATQDSINKAYLDTEMVNVTNSNNARAYNAQGYDKLERENATLMGLYDQQAGMAKANTEEDVKNYYDYYQRVNLGNFKNEQQLNLYNDLHDNFKVDSNNRIVKDGNNADFTIDRIKLIQAAQKLNDSKSLPSKKSTPTKTNK